MPAFQDLKFQAVRQTDRQIIEAFEALREEGLFPWATAELGLRIGPVINGSPENLSTNQLLQETLRLDSDLLRSFTFRSTSRLSVTLSRADNQTSDEVHVYLGAGREDQAPQGVSAVDIVRLEAGLRKRLRALNYSESLSVVLGKELREYYEIRESEVSKLESVIANAQERVLQESVSLRGKLEEEFQARARRLEEEVAGLRTGLQEDVKHRKRELDEREAALAKRLEEVDDRDARHVRRRIRQDLKEEFARRSQKFELTLGTRALRRPIDYFTLCLIILFGFGFVGYSAVSLGRLFGATVQPLADLVSLGVKQLFFGAAFGSTSLFYIRWKNQWFQRHAQEEFRLKRLELDFDRASWIVEMALEWRDEKGGELPPELLERLTNRIFDDSEEKSSNLHPLDQLATAIFGASAAATIKLPGGGELQLDRKSIRELEKLRNAE